jgi:hypothetical protein
MTQGKSRLPPTSSRTTTYRWLCESLSQIVIRTLLPLQEADPEWRPTTVRAARQALEQALSPVLTAQLASDPTLIEKILAVGISALGHRRVRRLARVLQRRRAIEQEQQTLFARRVSLLESVVGTQVFTEPAHARNALRRERDRVKNLLIPLRAEWLRLQLRRQGLLAGAMVLYAGEYVLTAGSFWPHLPGDDLLPYLTAAVLAFPTVLLLHYAAKTILYPALVRLQQRLHAFHERDHAWRNNGAYTTVTPPAETLPTENGAPPSPEASFWRQESALMRRTLGTVLGLMALLGFLQSMARGDWLTGRVSVVFGILFLTNVLVCLLAIAAESLRQKAHALQKAQEAPTLLNPLTEYTRELDSLERRLALLYVHGRTFTRISDRESRLSREDSALEARQTRQLAAFRPTMGMRLSLNDLAKQITALSPQVSVEQDAAIKQACREVFSLPGGRLREAPPSPSGMQPVIQPFYENATTAFDAATPPASLSVGRNGEHP